MTTIFDKFKHFTSIVEVIDDYLGYKIVVVEPQAKKIINCFNQSISITGCANSLDCKFYFYNPLSTDSRRIEILRFNQLLADKILECYKRTLGVDLFRSLCKQVFTFSESSLSIASYRVLQTLNSFLWSKLKGNEQSRTVMRETVGDDIINTISMTLPLVVHPIIFKYLYQQIPKFLVKDFSKEEMEEKEIEHKFISYSNLNPSDNRSLIDTPWMLDLHSQFLQVNELFNLIVALLPLQKGLKNLEIAGWVKDRKIAWLNNSCHPILEIIRLEDLLLFIGRWGSSLRCLNLEGLPEKAKEKGIDQINLIEKCLNLKHLILSSCGIDVEGMRRISELKNLSDLQSIELGGNLFGFEFYSNRFNGHRDFTIGNPRSLKPLSKGIEAWRSLQLLDLSLIPFLAKLTIFEKSIFFRALKEASQMKVLIFDSCELVDNDAELLSASLMQMSIIRQLSLGGNKIGDRGATFLAKSIEQLSELRWFDIGRDLLLRQIGIREIMKALKNSCKLLDVLELSEIPLLFEDVIQVTSTISIANKIQVLALGNNGIGNKGIELLSQGIAACIYLKEIDLTGNDIGDRGAKSLTAPLKRLNELREIGFECNRIGNLGAASIAEGLGGKCTLIKLNFSYNQIEDKGLELLGVALISSKSLGTLLFNHNLVKDKGALALVRLVKFWKELQHLDLGNNGISDLGRESLVELISGALRLKEVDFGESASNNSESEILTEEEREEMWMKIFKDDK